MYQMNLRAQASKLASMAARWQAARVQQRAALAGLANLATLRALPGASPDSATQHDPRDPRNW